MAKIEKIESIITENGFTDFRWINPKDIEVAKWVRVKCQFGCPDYGLGACPPNTPEVNECRQFFDEYHNAVIIKLTTDADKGNYPSSWSKFTTKNLLNAERKIFLQGYPKAFLLNQTCCDKCDNCSGDRVSCSDKRNSRPSPEAFAVDVYKTVKKIGMDIQVITENPSKINRIAILMVE